MSDLNLYAGYMITHEMEIEEKIKECLSAYRRGETTVTIDADGLSDSEIEHLREEVKRRILRGDY